MNILKTLVKYFLNLKYIHQILLIISNLKLTKNQKAFIKFNEANYEEIFSSRQILIDVFNVPEHLLAYSIFANNLAKISNSAIKPFLYKDTIFDAKVAKIYSSFNAKDLLRINLTKKQIDEVDKYIKAVNFKEKKDVIDYEINGVNLGIDIYESYLREFNKPTIELDDPKFINLLRIGLEHYVFFTAYLKKNDVSAIIVSHDNFIWTNILCKLGYLNKIPVYLPNCWELVLANKPFSVYEKIYHYKKSFNLLSMQQKKVARKLAKKQLMNKFDGKKIPSMMYIDQSPYRESLNKISHIKTSQNINILIATHCFFDNPHPYSKSNFVDFYEWLHFLGKLSINTNYDWYIKIHNDPAPGTEEIIKKILLSYPNINWIDKRANHNDLIRSGIDLAITSHGTIGEEYPYFDIPVLNCAINPRINYSFNFHLYERDKITDFIKNLPKFIGKKLNKNEIFEYYYTHHKMHKDDSLIFNSYEDFIDAKSSFINSDEAYIYFLSQINKKRLNEIEKKIKLFIKSKRNYSYINFLDNKFN